MREILFKAKRKDNGEWIKGSYIKDPMLEIHYIFCDNYDKNAEDYCENIEIIPETLCQYTGMKDENGKKIFENDIVIYDDGLAKIEWNNSCKAFLVVIFYMGYSVEEDLRKIKGCNLKVIRNIFDNPELLEMEE